MSDSVRPHRRQPIRLLCPWDSTGKNAGVGCHFLLQCMKVKSESEIAQSCPTFSDPMDCSLPGSSIHGIFQARVLEWGAVAFSAYKSKLLLFSVFCLFVCFLISVIYFSPVEIWFSCSFGGSDGKESTCNEGDLGLIPWLGRSPGGGHGSPLQNSFLETPHGQTNLVGYNPWGRKESETTEWLRTHLFSISFISKFNMINL